MYKREYIKSKKKGKRKTRKIRDTKKLEEKKCGRRREKRNKRRSIRRKRNVELYLVVLGSQFRILNNFAQNKTQRVKNTAVEMGY